MSDDRGEGVPKSHRTNLQSVLLPSHSKARSFPSPSRVRVQGQPDIACTRVPVLSVCSTSFIVLSRTHPASVPSILRGTSFESSVVGRHYLPRRPRRSGSCFGTVSVLSVTLVPSAGARPRHCSSLYSRLFRVSHAWLNQGIPSPRLCGPLGTPQCDTSGSVKITAWACQRRINQNLESTCPSSRWLLQGGAVWLRVFVTGRQDTALRPAPRTRAQGV